MMDLSEVGKLLRDVIGPSVNPVAEQLRLYAKDAGTACSVAGCDALTLGVRCEKCLRRTCMDHAFWRVAVLTKVTVPVKMTPFCPYCIVMLSRDAFSETDDESESKEGKGAADDVIDAEYETSGRR